VDPPDDCNSLASGMHPSSTELDAGRIDRAAPAAGAYTPIVGASEPRRGGGAVTSPRRRRRKRRRGEGRQRRPTPPPPPRGRGRRCHAIVVERAFVNPIFGTRSAPAASPPLPLRAPTTTIGAGSGREMTRRRAVGGRRSARIGAVGRQRQLAVARVGGGRRDERLKRAGGEEDAVTMLAAAARGAGSRQCKASRRRTMLQHGGSGRERQGTRLGGRRRGGSIV
jgi:hypothetical protein